MIVSTSFGGYTKIENYDEKTHPWVNDKKSPLGDQLKLCPYHSVPIEKTTKESQSWEEESVVENIHNTNNPPRFGVWKTMHICYDTCHVYSDIHIPDGWMIQKYPNLNESINELNQKILEASKEIHKLRLNISDLTKKNDTEDPYFVTLKDALIESGGEIKKYENDDKNFQKALKNHSIIQKQLDMYKNISIDKSSLMNLKDNLIQYEKIVEKYTDELKKKITDIIIIYMIDTSNTQLKKILDKYKNIVNEDQYEIIYRDKCLSKNIEKTLIESKNKINKYGNVIIDKNGEVKNI
jgi:hypothetical protein